MLPWNEGASAFASYFTPSLYFHTYIKLSAVFRKLGRRDPADKQAVNKGFLQLYQFTARPTNSMNKGVVGIADQEDSWIYSFSTVLAFTSFKHPLKY